MPVSADNKSVRNYNKWRISYFCIDTDNYTMKLKYGLCADLGGKYNYLTMNTIELSTEELAHIYLGTVNPDLNIKDNIKVKLYEYLIEKGLIDDNTIA